MSKYYFLSELNSGLDLIIVRYRLDVEETILKVFGTFAAGEENVVTCIIWQLRMKDLLVR